MCARASHCSAIQLQYFWRSPYGQSQVVVLSPFSQKYGNVAGLALIIFGTIMIALAAILFVMTAKAIESREEVPSTAHELIWHWRCCLFCWAYSSI